MIFISVLFDIWNNVWPYLIAIGLFLLLITIHEFGHFISAKALGVRVNEFAIGFGPTLFSIKGKETKYMLKLVPFGGYCAMEGEDAESFDTKAFCNKAAWRRFIIVAMGAIFNLLLGIIIVSVTLIPQTSFTSTVIAEFNENAMSEKSGLKVNDKIIAVDGRKIYTTYDLSYSFTNVDDGKLDITVLRDGNKKLLKDVNFQTATEDDISYITLDFKVYGIKKTLKSFIKHTFDSTLSLCAVIWRSLFDLIGGKYGISAISGPVGVTVAIGNVAKQSLINILPIMALITINLGLFNLLPIPALDGGRLLFILIEMIFRKPVPQKYETLVHTVGFMILIAFMILVAAKDIWVLIFK